MRRCTFALLLCLGVLAPRADAAFPGRDGPILHADLVTDKQQAHATYLRSRPLRSTNGSEWLTCSNMMGFPCGTTLTPDVGGARYSPDGHRVAVALTGSALGPPGGEGLVTMSATGPPGYAPDAAFASVPGIATVAWSPDGARLVAEVDGDLVLLSATGDRKGTLTTDGRSPDWSSRGQVAFVRGGNIWTMRVGRQAHQLTHRGGGSPSWAPDGRSLAFTRGNHVFTVRRDGRQLRRLVARVADLPVWSPSGRSLAILSNHDLYVVRADGTRARRLLNYGPPDKADFSATIDAIDWRPLPR
jgi:dipeptidyl aminopeptidase/acylaminoacyl peptidase